MKFFLKVLQLVYRYILLILKFLNSKIKKVIQYIHSKKRLAIPFYGFLLFVLYIVALIQFSGDSTYNKVLDNKQINDVTQLNPIQVNKIIKPKTDNEIIKAITTTTGSISIGGGKYSMGGQTAFRNSLHIDMRSLNKVISLDKQKKQVTVQAGIRWRDLQKQIDPLDLSIKIMQTYSNFTVGGSISVNCHGRYIGHGPIISSVIALKIITASGEVIIANRNSNQDVFKAAVGGYGGIGVITEATLQLVDNVKIERHDEVMDVSTYNTYFNTKIKNNKAVLFQNGDLYPPNYDEIRSVYWEESTKELTDKDRLISENEHYWLEVSLEKVVSMGNTGKWLKKNWIDPLVYYPEKIKWRNKEASYDVRELEPSSREKDTYVLQEYFIPVNNIKSFIPKMRTVFQKYDVNVMNVSLRHALADKESYLSWANEEVFAFVVYYKQNTDEASRQNVEKWTVAMTDAILSERGTWYLPYQPHATFEQFKKGYPNYEKYFDLKSKLDPNQRFTNQLIDKYNPNNNNKLAQTKSEIKGYYRAEEQTILTIPEWYLVFNPKEYSDYLESGKNPSDFPFYQSIDEYWKLYDRSLKLTSKAYPENPEYKTMLQVIGVSLTMEYGVKILYENTIGKLFSYLSKTEKSNEEALIIEAQRAYSDFIYQTAWYEFQFMPWIKKVWNVPENTTSYSVIRKWERVLFFTFEFSFKAFYSKLIEIGASSTYEEPVNTIFLTVANDDALKEDSDIKVIERNGEKMMLSITRWGIFTEVMKELSDENIQIQDISGNDEIAVSVVSPVSVPLLLANNKPLYTSRIVSNNKLERNVFLIPVSKLMLFIKNVTSNGYELEHVYDY
ncbi:FAD-dependent oxidoreductase [Flavobacterium sp. NG2]|uniref:FAD-dependent oxidoreductase n=1 Tax=Flavobacterium sp. NG2 TaxID=3097547 RepID=UPI002A81B79B|nr:FAD-dependent oxidoreductase [Flavobacterium sp. NG2]WPR70426.1 FAD-dependent oxidoreductase [Flavobacterium sp. NG2]